MGSININGTTPTKIIFNDYNISKVYLNGNNIISNGLSMGNITVYYMWRYTEVKEGTGCSPDYYYYPDDLKLVIIMQNFIGNYNIKWEVISQSSDCLTINNTSGSGEFTRNTARSFTLTGNKSWSEQNGGYINIGLKITITDINGVTIATLKGSVNKEVTANWNTTYLFNNKEVISQ